MSGDASQAVRRDAVTIQSMDAPPPERLLESLAALPAGAPLLARLGGRPDVYAVGGAVRDLLLGGRPLDLDVAVEGDALAVARELGGEVRAHARFGTATVRLGGHLIDLASTRRERYPRPGALPVVEPADIATDLRRRDFTVNALAAPLGGPRAGTLLTAPGALDDLEGRRLRVLHGRSFLDDPTRLFRLARYAARLGFAPGQETEALASAAVADGALATVSGERIGRELRLIAAEPTALAAMADLRRVGVDAAVAAGFGIDDEALARTALELLPADGRRDLLLLALATLRLSGQARRAVLARLAVRGGDGDTVLAAAGRAPALAGALAGANSPAEIAAALDGAPVEAVALAGALGPAAVAGEWFATGRHVGLTITGQDLVAAGVPRGPGIGAGLRAALAAKRAGEAADRGAELAVALAAARAVPGKRRR